jgi:hypothetical protein
MLCVWKLFKARPTLILQGYSESWLKSSFWKFYGPRLRLQIITGLYVEWSVSCPLLDCHFHTRYLNLTKDLTADVTSQLRMLTPPWHLILPSLLLRSMLPFRYFFWIMITLNDSCRTVALWFYILVSDHNATDPVMQKSCNLRRRFFCAL